MEVFSYNISFNKSLVWYVDSTINKKKNPYDFYKVLTFKWHMSKFGPNLISFQIIVV